MHHLTSLELLNFSAFSREENWQKMRISEDSTSPRCWLEKKIYSCLLIYLFLLSESSLSHALLHKPQQCCFTLSLNVLLENGFYMKCIVTREDIFLARNFQLQPRNPWKDFSSTYTIKGTGIMAS